MASGRASGSFSDTRAHYNVFELEPEETESDCFTIQEEMEELNTSRDIEEESPSKIPKRKQTERRAKVWDHYTLYTNKNGKTRASCHYIDDCWRLHKVIMNFIPFPSHKDLKRRLVSWETAILDGKFFLMRCEAHIINLVVKDGLKGLNGSIERVRTVLRYVRQSPVRLKKFKDYAVEEKVESKKPLSLDVPTRWNSVYVMLQTAVIFQGVFERYKVSDADVRADFLPGYLMEILVCPKNLTGLLLSDL